MNRQDAVRAVRTALRDLPVIAQWSATDQPDLNLLVTPRAHARALDPDEIVVEGDRGVGKSFWSAVLRFDDARQIAARAYPSLGLDRLTVSLGFAQARRPEYPSAAILRTIISVPAAVIWKVVTLRAAAKAVSSSLPEELTATSWLQASTWLYANPEEEEKLFSELDAALKVSGKRLLVIFDALDRIGGTDWGAVRRLVRGILQAGLEIRDSYPTIRFKAFLRNDFFNDEEIWRFPDASKIKGAAARLIWTVPDLYALLFTRLRQAGVEFALRELSPKLVTSDLLTDAKVQQQAVDAMAGEYMGGVRRGRVYVWLPAHLADARGETSPRSFLLALKDAAEKTPDTFSLPLWYLQIRDSVQRASEIRVDELNEDHPWLSAVLQSLDGLVVPAERSDVSSRFTAARLQQVFARRAASRDDNAAPEDLVPTTPIELAEPDISGKEFSDRLMLALKRLHVLEERPDRRINVPDLFRVAAGIKRKGGVPVSRK
jgi:hypothetical protein